MSKSTPTKTRQRATPRVSLRLDSSGGANQADAPAANINTIVAQYMKHGTMPAIQQKNPLYGDFTHPTDIHSIREAVHQAEDRFDQLPADIRTAAGNDWVQFLDMFEDPENLEKLTQAGLIVLPEDNSTPQKTKSEAEAPLPTPKDNEPET